VIIDEMITLFLDGRKRGKRGLFGAKKKCSEKTLKIYQRNLVIFRNYFQSEVSCGGITKIESIKKMEMVRFFDWLDEKVKRKDWSEATVIQLLGCLRTFFIWAAHDEEVVEVAQYAEQLRAWLPPIPEKPRRTDIPEVRDLKRFKNSFNTDDKWEYRDYVLVCLLVDTGVRAGEAANLRVDSCRLNEGLLFVTGKTGPRTVPITEDMGRILKGWLRRRETCPKAKDSPYVFVSKRAPQLNVDAIGHSFRKHKKKFGLPRITAHTFRHAYAINYLEMDGNMENLRLNMGHSTYEMLRKYLGQAKQRSKSAHTELERVSLSKKM